MFGVISVDILRASWILCVLSDVAFVRELRRIGPWTDTNFFLYFKSRQRRALIDLNFPRLLKVSDTT